MEYKVKKNNNATAEITIQFTHEELDAGFQKAYLNNKDKVKVPGFRPGKAPLAMIQKILGESVTEEAINNTLSEGIAKIFPELDPRPIRFPQFQVTDEVFDRTKGFNAIGIYDTYPEVTLPKIKKVKIDTYEVQPTEAEIQKELETIQTNLARNVLKEEGEEILDGNLLEMNYRFAPEGEELPEQKHTGKYSVGNQNNPEGFDSHLIGMKIGETKTFEFTYPEEFPQAPESAGKKYNYEITITAAYTVTLPEINDDMASEYDGSENLDELKKKISDRLSTQKNEELKNHSFIEIYEKLVEDGKFIIPENLIREEGENVFTSMFQNYGMPVISMEDYCKQTNSPLEETVQRFQAMGLKRLQGYFLRQKIAEVEKIQVTDQDLQDRMKTLAESFQEDLDSFTKRMEKEDRLGAIRDNLLLEKVDDFVYDSIEKKGPKAISLEEASKILNRENQTV